MESGGKVMLSRKCLFMEVVINLWELLDPQCSKGYRKVARELTPVCIQ
jgi:hypothetical protein